MQRIKEAFQYSTDFFFQPLFKNNSLKIDVHDNFPFYYKTSTDNITFTRLRKIPRISKIKKNT